MSSLLIFLYQIFLIAAGPFYLFVRFFQGKRLPGFRQRLARYPKDLESRLRALDRPVWIHMVSVGEAIAAAPLIEEVRRFRPGQKWLMTTTTGTGREMARKLLRPGDELIYLPWDFTPFIRRLLALVRPALLISFETELWPVLYHELRRKNIPIIVVNGRISPSAYRRYLWARPLIQRVLAQVDFFLTQSPQDARRFAALGAPKDRIQVAGNLKWDVVNQDGKELFLPLSAGEILLTAGSTHPGEERTVLEVYERLRKRFPPLRLLIAPRHPERVAEVEKEVSRVGLSAVRRSQEGGGSVERSVILLDTLGELACVYQKSDIVFVGGSLVPHGGHNLIEPASAGKPIVTGPHLHNFEAVSEVLRAAGGLMVVGSADELEKGLAQLVGNPAQRATLGKRAAEAIGQHRGATRRHAEFILGKYLR